MQRYSLTKIEVSKWGILFAIALIDAAVIALTPIEITASPKLIGLSILGTVGSLSIAAFYHYVRDEPQFTHSFVCVLQFSLFTLAGCVMTYLAVALQSPLQDENLIRFDRSLGVHVEDIVHWIKQFPALSQLLAQVYFSLLIQFVFLFAYLGVIRGERERLDEFVLLMMITLILTTVIAGFFPAAGPCHEFGFRVAPFHQNYIDALEYMRTSPAPRITLNEAEGMLVFPSFHSVLACMLIYAFRRDKYTYPFMLAVNLAMLASTLTHGCHYLADILAGLVVFAVGLLIYKLCFRPLATANEPPAP